jgi:hypothetical protein
MKATACPTYPTILVNSSRADARRSSAVLLYSYPDDLMESGRRHPRSILIRNGAVKTGGMLG